jgi:predicted metal-dependent hydrolase
MKPQGTQLSLFETRGSSDPFAVRVSSRARRLTARVHIGGRVEIVVPVGVSARAVRDFVQRFTPWIDRKVAAMQCYAAPSAEVPEHIDFMFTGERFELEWRHSALRSVPAPDGDRLVVHAADAEQARLKLRGWLKAAAEERLVPELMRLARELKYPVQRVVIRCQRTRWGSCSTRGTVSLNCSLVFLRPQVVRYLFVHELAHLRHMNHSTGFWRLVEALEPDYRSLDRELLAGWRTVPLWVFKA